MSKLLTKAAKSLKSANFLSSESVDDGCFIDEDGDTFLDAQEALLHPDAHADGGLACTDTKLLEQQRNAIMEVMKSLGRNLLTGNFDLLRMSLPVKLFEPRSYLQKLADPWCYPHLLEQASATSDPEERMRLVVTYILAGFHRAFLKWAKPFNPILGETFQATLNDGSHIFLEQISHHPPISAFQMIGPHGKYEFRGHSTPAVAYKANAIKTSASGRREFVFSDGGRIEVTYPYYYIRGLLYTSSPRAELGGTAEFIDHDNGLRAIIRFGKIDGATSSILQRTDAFTGTMQRLSPTANGDHHVPVHRTKTSVTSMTRLVKTLPALGAASKSFTDADAFPVVSKCSGNWLSHVEWDGERYWSVQEDNSEEWIPDPHALPSDCHFREDLVALQKEDIVEAQAKKELLENLQRKDAKLRKDGKELAKVG